MSDITKIRILIGTIEPAHASFFFGGAVHVLAATCTDRCGKADDRKSYGYGSVMTEIANSDDGTDWVLRCPLLGAKPTWPFALHMSANDPKRTSLLAALRFPI